MFVVGRAGLIAAAALALLVSAASAVANGAQRAAVDQKKVLVVYSTRRDTQIAIAGDREVPRLVEKAFGMRPDYYAEYIDGARFPDAEYKAAFLHYLRLKYQGSRFDVVIAIENPAYDFVRSVRDELFGQTPIVFIAQDQPIARASNSAGVLIARDFRSTLRFALALQPDTTQVFVVVGSSNHDRAMEQNARRQLQSITPQIPITYLSNLAIDDLERRIAALPPHSIVYALLFYQDANGVNVNPLDYLERVASIANRPTYCWVDSMMDRGILGGHLISIDSQLAAVTGVAINVMRGEPADRLPLATVDAAVDEVDWRQLRRWNIPESRVPAGTLVRFRPPGLWERYRGYIVGLTVIVLGQLALIVALVAQSARRRRAEETARAGEADLRKSYDRIHDLSARLITVQETERARISRDLHDDIGQQLALVSIDLDMFNRTRTAETDRVPEQVLNRLQTASSSIHELSHQLHPAKLQLVGLVPALAGLARELSRDGLSITFSHARVPAMPPDLALCLFRIAQEALQNVVKHSGAHAVSVRLRGARSRVMLIRP